MFFGQKVHRDGPKLGQKINSTVLLLGHKIKKHGSGSNHNYEEERKAREREEKRQNHSYLERYV
jgi:hypothetical protein